ncbi:MAG: replicative DNA helicase [Gemmatimonadota bacterium]
MTSVSHASSSHGTADPQAARQTPWSEEAEQAVLGAMLLDQDAALKAAQLLSDTAFHRDSHRRIFRSMLILLEKGDVIDPLLLRDVLQRRGDLEASGGVEYIAELLDIVPTSANVEYHCRIVRDRALRRRLIEAGTAIVQTAYEGPEEVNALLDSAEQRIFEVSFQRESQEFTRLKSLVWDTMERIEARHQGEESAHGVCSGFADLDELTNGFQPSDLIIVAARPSMGKSAFCLNIATHAAVEENVSVGVFSLEMAKDQLVERMLASESLVDLHRFRQGKLLEEDFSKLSRAVGILGQARIWIDDTPGLNLLELRSKARRLKAEHGIGVFIIDYLQLINAPRASENRQAEIAFISRSLKALARELRTPVVALSQLSRAPELRGGDRRPMLSDLRDSGAIEQDADLVLFIYRAEMYKSVLEKDQHAREGIAEVILAKHRNGPTGTITLAFRKDCTRFADYTERKAESFDVP